MFDKLIIQRLLGVLKIAVAKYLCGYLGYAAHSVGRHSVTHLSHKLAFALFGILDKAFCLLFSGSRYCRSVSFGLGLGILKKLLLALFVFGSGFFDILSEGFGLSLGFFGVFDLLAYAASAAAEHLVEKIHLSADEIQSAEQYDKVNYFPYDIHLRTIPPFP